MKELYYSPFFILIIGDIVAKVLIIIAMMKKRMTIAALLSSPIQSANQYYRDLFLHAKCK
jgi:hypothetical protein